jgi:fatty acid desaturase
MATAAAESPRSAHALNDADLLRQINALRDIDNLTGWFYLGREWLFLAAVIGGTIAFYYLLLAHGWSLLWGAPVTLVAIVCVGAGQHRLATLTHEAAHYMLFRNRLLNELVSEWFCMFPLLGQTHPYRVQHLGHHQYPNDPERDPDWEQMVRSGHRYEFPMSRGRFLWQCCWRQVLWIPALIRYVLVRATYVVDQGGGPYRMKRRTWWPLRVLGIVYLVTLIGILTWGVWHDERTLLWVAPLAMYAAALAAYALAPSSWLAEFAIKSDLPVRAQVCLRLTFYTLLAAAIAWGTILTGMPWWLFYCILWLAPLGTSFALFMILRQIVQHGNADQARYTNTRVFLVNSLLSMAVFPIGNDYHLPHHLFPLVPHYNLPKLHELLMRVDEYRDQAVVVHGYFIAPGRPQEHPTVVDVMTRDAVECDAV